MAGGGDNSRTPVRNRADPELLAHLESYSERADQLLSRAGRSEIGSRLKAAPPTRFRLDAWRLRLAGEPREIERPPQIGDDLQRRTPQAILRDLHRPVRHVPAVRLRPVVKGPDLSAASGRTREAMHTRYTVRMDTMPKVREVLAEERTALRALLIAPWEEALPKGEIRPANLEPGPEDAYWFGAFGGVDPDQ